MTGPTHFDLDELAAQTTIDLTTTGRKTGQPRRIEIWWFRVDEKFIITGTPGRRGWLANIKSDPQVIVHVRGIEIPALAHPVDDVEFRRRVLTDPQTSWYRTQSELEALVARAPMVEVILEVPQSRPGTPLGEEIPSPLESGTHP